MLKRLANIFIFCLLSLAAEAQKPTVETLPGQMDSLFTIGDNKNDSLFLKAVDLYALDNPDSLDKAYDILRRLELTQSDNDAINYYCALCEMEKRKYDDCCRHFEKAWQLDSNNVWYGYCLSQLYLGLRKMDSGIRLINKLIKKDPALFTNSVNLTLLGDWNLAQAKDSIALDYYNQSLVYEPGNSGGLFGKADVFNYRRDFNGMFAVLDEAAASRTVEPSMLNEYLLGIIRAADMKFYNQWKGSLGKVLDKSMDIHPDFFPMRELKIQLCYLDSDTTGVIRNCEAIIARGTEKDSTYLARAYTTLADTYHAQGRKKESFVCYEKCLEIIPDHAPALNNYAYFLCTEGKNLEKARIMSAASLVKDPDNPTYLDTYGWILYKMGNAQEAKKYLKKAILCGGKKSKEILLHISEVLRALKEDSLADYYKSIAETK